MSPKNLSLRTKLVAVISALLFAIAIFLWLFFPARMDAFSRRWLERRAEGMATILASAAAPAIEFDDPAAVQALLSSVSSSGELVYAVVYRPNGSVLSAYKPELAPPGSNALPEGSTVTAHTGDQLRLKAPIKGRSGAGGVLSLGFTLDELKREKRSQDLAVAWVSLVVFLVGLAASALIGTVLVRPVREMTDVALRIARGDLSQQELQIAGQDEVGQMAAA